MPAPVNSRRRPCLNLRMLAWTASLVAVAAMATGAAQVAGTPDLGDEKSPLSRSADPNVKPGAEVNVRDKPSGVVAPPGKTGAARASAPSRSTTTPI